MIKMTLTLAGMTTALLFATGLRVAPAAGGDGDGDEKAIRALIAGMTAAWNNHDMKAYAAAFTADGEIVNRFGQRYRGRDKVLEHLIELHESPFRDRLVGRSSLVESVRFITPDVAMAHDSFKEGKGGDLWTCVLSKKAGQWQVESCNVNVIGNPGAGPPPSR